MIYGFLQVKSASFVEGMYSSEITTKPIVRCYITADATEAVSLIDISAKYSSTNIGSFLLKKPYDCG